MLFLAHFPLPPLTFLDSLSFFLPSFFHCTVCLPTHQIHISEHGQVAGETNMMAELVARGPIAATIAVPEALETYTGGIFNDTTGAVSLDHEIEIVGYGVENGVKYWSIRNSWGTYWGEQGWFRLIRGTNNLGKRGREEEERGW